MPFGTAADYLQIARSWNPRSGGALPQDGNSCTQVSGRIVEKFNDEVVALEHLLNDGALDAAPAAVNQSHLSQAGSMSLADVLIDDRWNVVGSERMEIERRLDRNSKWMVVGEWSFSVRTAPSLPF